MVLGALRVWRPCSESGRIRWGVLLAAGVVAGCAAGGSADRGLAPLPAIQTVLDTSPARDAVARQLPNAVERELLPALQVPMPELPQRPPEPRFDLNVADASLQQLLPAIVQGTRYSMVVHPEVKGVVTLRLRDTTLPEVLDVIRDLYGWDWRQEGQRLQVMPATLQTRLFRINYPTSARSGRSETRVMSGSITGGSSSTTQAAGADTTPGSAAGSLTSQEGTRVTTQHRNDLWLEIESTLKLLVGDQNGRQVVVAPQSGLVVVRAMPNELRSIQEYLQQMRLSVERQVMLEAKIVEVRLRDGYQSGVNWAAFRPGGDTRLSAGVLAPGAQLTRSGALSQGALSANPPGAALALSAQAAAGLFGLALQTDNFAAMLSFLETQGQVQVLSSPRIATLNNQKAVLKVGSDDFFVTNVSTTTVTGGAGSTSTPSITLQPFFSGIALDVTPQIDETGQLILHVRPSVSQVQERQKQLDLGSLGSFSLPLASSSVRETDAIVRVPDGQIVAIGGLMRQDAGSDRAQVPGMGDLPVVGRLFGQRSGSSSKQELVILIKPTVIRTEADWAQSHEQARAGLRGLLPVEAP